MSRRCSPLIQGINRINRIGRLGLVACLLASCARTHTPQAQDPWSQWLDMELPVRVAKSRVAKTSAQSFDRFAQELRAGRYASALSALDHGTQDPFAKAWAQVLQGHLAGLHTQSCEQGQWLRFAPFHPKDTTKVSMIALLDALHPLVEHQDPILARHAQIAQVRILVIARDCPGSPMVQTRAREKLPLALQSLVKTQGPSLPPDLAYLWATQCLEQEQWSLARTWLTRARKQGFDDPRVSYALAQSWYGQKDWAKAQTLALQSAKALPSTLATMRAATWTLAARAALMQGQAQRSRALLAKARKDDPQSPQMLALQVRLHAEDPLGCDAALGKALSHLWTLSWSKPPRISWILDETLYLADQDGASSLQCLNRALVWDIDNEPDPALRAIRYYYAATLDARLGDEASALGRALLARAEFESAGTPRHPFPIQALIDALKDAHGDAM